MNEGKVSYNDAIFLLRSSPNFSPGFFDAPGSKPTRREKGATIIQSVDYQIIIIMRYTKKIHQC